MIDWVWNKRPSATKPTGEIHLSCFCVYIQNKIIHFKLVQIHIFSSDIFFYRIECHVQYSFVNFPLNFMVKCMRIVIMNANIATMTNENHNVVRHTERKRGCVGGSYCRIREYFRCVMYRCTCQRQAPTAYSRLKRLSSSWCWECAKDEIGCTPLPTSRQYALYLRLTFWKQMVFVFNFSLSSLAIFEGKFDWIFITTFMIWFLSIFSLWKKNDSLFRHELVDETEVINMSNFCSFFFVWINFINWFANMWEKSNSHISI